MTREELFIKADMLASRIAVLIREIEEMKSDLEQARAELASLLPAYYKAKGIETVDELY